MISCSRREFLGRSLAGVSLLSTARPSWGASSANEQINLGIIGCGWRGGQLLDLFGQIEGVKILGLCDPDRQRMSQLGERAPAAKQWVDMRHMFAAADIDAVVIATCNHWHCLAAIWAVQAGKHVYVEKPLCHFLWEGRQLIRAVARHRKVCQVGTQQRSDPMQRDIKQFLHVDCGLGQVQSVHVNRFGVRQPIGKRSTPLQVPPTLEYDLWVGPAKDQPIYRQKLHYDWHWDWNTGSGEMGNWGVHLVDDVRNTVFQDRLAFPQRISAVGGRFVWDDAGNTPNLQLAAFATGDIPVTLGICNLPRAPGESPSPIVPGPGSGYTVFCEGGRLEGQRGSASAYDADGQLMRNFRGNKGTPDHQQNFIDCVRQENVTNLHAPVEVGYLSTAWCDLANIATRVAHNNDEVRDHAVAPDAAATTSADEEVERMKRVLLNYGLTEAAQQFHWGPTLQFEEDTERFVGDSAAVANEYLRRQDRDSFTVPEVPT